MVQVVVVERDPTLGRLYQEELSDAGFDVRVPRCLDEAVATLRREPAHILVTDIDSMGGPISAGLGHLRQVHDGPLLILGPAKACRELPEPNLPLVEKTSDLSVLISHLRGRTLSVMWSGAVTAVC